MNNFKIWQLNHFFRALGVLILLGAASSCADAQQEALKHLKAPDGFSIEVFAQDIDNVRQLALGDDGAIYAGSRGAGRVYAIIDKNNDYKADQVYIIDEDLRLPSGVTFRDGSLYVAALNRILRYDNITQKLQNPPEPVEITDDYPTEGHHGWKFIAFGPDGKLYIPVGAPCNICNREKKIYATISRINTDGTGREIVARGVRNSVGFDWDPHSGDLWFTDNGRDWLGDNSPPDELNHLTKKGQHFGYPYKFGNDVWDPEFGEKGKKIASNFWSPARELGPHVAPLGMIFYTGNTFPASYKNNILIAEHGSWNRSDKIGYRITAVTLKNGKVTSYKPFINGWLGDNGAVWGRPVDLLQLLDGSVLVSDDHRDAIYRITYNDSK